jgi:hypothetical protein
MSILVLTSDTLIGTPASGNLEYNGQFFGTDSNASRAQLQRIVRATAVATTSGTSIDFTAIPAWVERITVMFSGVSTNGTSIPLLQIGDSGGVETSGYLGSGSSVFNGSTTSAVSQTTGFGIGGGMGATVIFHGAIQITLLDATANTWCANGVLGRSDAACVFNCGGAKSLSATLDRVRITTVNGTDTFDAGSINILYEG